MWSDNKEPEFTSLRGDDRKKVLRHLSFLPGDKIHMLWKVCTRTHIHTQITYIYINIHKFLPCMHAYIVFGLLYVLFIFLGMV